MVLKVIGGFLICFLLGGSTGVLLEVHRSVASSTHGRPLFSDNGSLLVPGIILTIVLALVYTFLTPIGPAIFSLFGGKGPELVIFGGSAALPLTGGIIVVFVMLFLGCTTGLIVLCLLGIIVDKLRDKRYRRYN